ncbi:MULTISPECIES: FAD:protein FMN transferase [Methylobacterium]|uniref:FAD:protein FMN transferase n=1 Tax=Methylobacterium TaxID=407 RepID=UPI0009F8A26A|nr:MULTISPECIES: FAD:protein FMN transferase [Methylobacterium]NGM37365.1 FAD:protein FMN transferase [Methylobacterium sp. DB0501]
MRRVLIPPALPPIGCAAPEGTLVAWSGEMMGTTWSVKAVVPDGHQAEDVRTGFTLLLDGIDREMSQWRPESDLTRFNQAPAGTWVPLPSQLRKVLAAGLDLARLTDGAYDPTIGALTDLWGFGPPGPIRCRPGAAAIQAAQARSGFARVRLDPASGAAFQPGGIQLDLCGIAKGYAVDVVSEALTARGLTNHLVEIGGELRGAGIKPDRTPWWVRLEEPPGSERPATVVALHGLAVATSGDYRRVLSCEGERHGHTLDPRTGVPLSNGPLVATVLHAACLVADVAATALMVLGLADGLAFAERHRLAARVITRAADNQAHEYTSSIFKRMLS